MKRLIKLLIEPVWNQNSPNIHRTFRNLVRTFNRTSLESKLTKTGFHCRFDRHLLIEPVWNQNFTLGFMDKAFASAFNRTSLESKLAFGLEVVSEFFSLLIEPVWNQNSLNSFSSRPPNSLLIEPVWNQNFSLSTRRVLRFLPFNRTSLESKP